MPASFCRRARGALESYLDFWHHRLVRHLALLVVLVLGCGTVQPPPGGQPCNLGNTVLNGALWTQNASEARAAALQTYVHARVALDTALAAPATSTLPPAIILDLDETVFDNTQYAAQQIRKGQTFTFGSDWDAWVAQSTSRAVPGALEFLTDAQSRGVTPFYITNRTTAHDAATRLNLQKLGFPLADGTLLVRTDDSYDKTARRESVAARYRVLMYFGDAMGDFPSGETAWGTRAFVISNPMYGSWESAGSGTDCEKVQNKLDALHP